MKRLLVIAFAAGCTGSPPVATFADAQRAHIELAELQQGRQLLVSKCGGCHRPPMPTDHAASDWPIKLDEMAGRANLNAAQRRSLETYLVVMASRPQR